MINTFITYFLGSLIFLVMLSLGIASLVIPFLSILAFDNGWCILLYFITIPVVLGIYGCFYEFMNKQQNNLDGEKYEK